MSRLTPERAFEVTDSNGDRLTLHGPTPGRPDGILAVIGINCEPVELTREQAEAVWTWLGIALGRPEADQ